MPDPASLSDNPLEWAAPNRLLGDASNCITLLMPTNLHQFPGPVNRSLNTWVIPPPNPIHPAWDKSALEIIPASQLVLDLISLVHADLVICSCYSLLLASYRLSIQQWGVERGPPLQRLLIILNLILVWASVDRLSIVVVIQFACSHPKPHSAQILL